MTGYFVCDLQTEIIKKQQEELLKHQWELERIEEDRKRMEEEHKKKELGFVDLNYTNLMASA